MLVIFEFQGLVVFNLGYCYCSSGVLIYKMVLVIRSRVIGNVLV